MTGRSGSARLSALQATGLSAGYGGEAVVHDMDIQVGEGEVLALLGPSGSGKTTVLSAIAGFLRLTAGELRIAGRVVAGPRIHVPPEGRRIGVVFQSYALWPHLTVLDNVAYPIRRRGRPGPAARAEARAILERLGIAQLAERHPAELSGGEQQRVGLGRALAREAQLYLFDEPTAHLDAPLRARLQEELAEHRRQSGAAAVYATHDTAEALSLADRVALLRRGAIVQHGSPAEVYQRPVDLWAAQLTGPASLVEVALLGTPGAGGAAPAGPARLAIGDRQVDASIGWADGALPAGSRSAGPLQLLVRPDWARLGGSLPARVAAVAYRGTHTDYTLHTVAGSIGLRAPGTPSVARGSAVGWTLERGWVLAPPPGDEGEGLRSGGPRASPE